jgi:hypothetical protein
LVWSIVILYLLASDQLLKAQPGPDAVASFDAYISTLESRLARQHQSQSEFLALPTTAHAANNIPAGDPVIEQLVSSPAANLPGALLHHWRGTAFVRGAKAADFERLMKDVGSYPRYFSPQVLQAKTLTPSGTRGSDYTQVWMRVRQQRVITVVMDTSYDVHFGRLDARHGFSASRSTRISEIDSPGTSGEHALGPGDEHGFLWKQDTYWAYEERDNGLYMQVESVSLTRSIPAGLGWVIRPYIDSVPRESLEFTLKSVCDALRPGQTLAAR